MKGLIKWICLLLLIVPVLALGSDLSRIFLPLSLKSEIKLPDEIIKIPVVAEGKLFYSIKNKVYARDLFTEEELWTCVIDDLIATEPVYFKGNLYFGSTNYNLYVVNADGGKVEWEYKTEGMINSSPVVSEEAVYVLSLDGYLYKIGISDHNLIWKARIDKRHARGLVAASISLSRGCVFIGTLSGFLYSIDDYTGEVQWKKKVGESIESRPIIYEDKIIVGTHNRIVGAYSQESGKKIWEFLAQGDIKSSPVLLHENAYIQSDDGKLYALEIASGKLFWTYDISKKSRGRRPNVSQYKIFTTTSDKFVVLDSESGEILWSYPIEAAESFSSPLVINGYVIIQAGNYLYVFEHN